VVVHLHRVRSVEVDDVGRDPLAEVGLEGVDAHGRQPAQLPLEPGLCRGVGEVDDAHAGLPEVGLPHRAVLPLEKVALLRRLGEERRALADVGVDPEADPEATGMEAL